MSDNLINLMFSDPAAVELQGIVLDILSKKGAESADREIDLISAELEKLRENPFLGFEVPRQRPAGKGGRVVARRGLRIFLIGGKYVAYYKTTQTDVMIYHIFERGTRYPTIVERDLGED